MAEQTREISPAVQIMGAARHSAASIATFLRELFRHPQSAAGTLIVLFFLVLALFGTWIAPDTENDQTNLPRLAPSCDYPFGTDYLGRDVFSRVILGASSIFRVAGCGTLIAVVIGRVVGLLSGYQGGWADEIASRVIDALLALPALLIALVILGVTRNLE